MLSKIRHNLNDADELFDGVVQLDEAYIGGRSKGRFKHNRGRSFRQKAAVFGILNDTRAYTRVVPDANSKTLQPIAYALVKHGATVVTDGWRGYHGISKHYSHKVVEHAKGVYVKDGYHTNGIEGFWSHLKRGLKGTYHAVKRKHLQSYCNEFAYRYNTRRMTDTQKFIQFVAAKHKRLTYAELTM
jgi:transposase-like protein